MEAYVHRKIYDMLLAAKKPLFVSDKGIDGDSLGASLALADWMKECGMHIPVHVSGPVPDKYQGLPRMEHCVPDDTLFEDPDIDLIVTFDCSNGEYIEGLLARLPAPVPIINIDHHVTNPLYGDVNQVVTESSATADVIYRFFKENDITPSRDAATLMLAGISFDTGNFQNSSTNSRAFEAASDLVLQGARIHDVIRLLFANRPVGALKLLGKALERLEEREGGVITTYLTRKDMETLGVSEEEADGLSNFVILSIDRPTFIWFRETADGDVKASMRSIDRDVSKVATAFGGGGHAKSAGFSLKGASIQHVRGGWYIKGHEDMYTKIDALLNA